MTFSGILAWLATNEGTTIALLTFAGVAIIALIFTMPWKGAAVTPEQCRQARRLMGWSEERLGRAVGLSESVINAFEHEGYLPSPAETWLAEIRAELEGAGVEFVDSGASPGARFRRGQSD